MIPSIFDHINKFDEFVQYICRISHWREFSVELNRFEDHYRDRLDGKVQKLGTIKIFGFALNDDQITVNEYVAEISFEQLIMDKWKSYSLVVINILQWGIELHEKERQLKIWISELALAQNRVRRDNNYNSFPVYVECLDTAKKELSRLKVELIESAKKAENASPKDFTKDGRGKNGHKNLILLDDSFYKRAHELRNQLKKHAYSQKKPDNPSENLIMRLFDENIKGYKVDDTKRLNPLPVSKSTIKRKLIENKIMWDYED